MLHIYYSKVVRNVFKLLYRTHHFSLNIFFSTNDSMIRNVTVYFINNNSVLAEHYRFLYCYKTVNYEWYRNVSVIKCIQNFHTKQLNKEQLIIVGDVHCVSYVLIYRAKNCLKYVVTDKMLYLSYIYIVLYIMS